MGRNDLLLYLIRKFNIKIKGCMITKNEEGWYVASEGMCFKRKSDNLLFGNMLKLGNGEKIEDFTEVVEEKKEESEHE